MCCIGGFDSLVILWGDGLLIPFDVCLDGGTRRARPQLDLGQLEELPLTVVRMAVSRVILVGTAVRGRNRPDGRPGV